MNAMFEVFSRTGTPAELLTDQGSVFMGKLTLQLCDKWNIKKLNTSAYHPQTGGCLERWLEKMLLKCGAHLWHIKHVLDRLRQHGLTARPKKCERGANKLEYFSFVVGKGLWRFQRQE